MKPLGKRIAVLILVLSLALSAAVAGVAVASNIEEKPDYTVMVISDTHVFSEEHVGDLCEDFLSFDAGRTGRVQYLTECVFRNTLDKIKEAKPNALFISGDLVDTATLSTHREVAGYLKEVEALGIEVFVVPGNHDIASRAPSFENGYLEYVEAASYEDFKEIYGDFGYNEAVKSDDKSISYAADMGDKYRVISIDATRAKNNPELSDDLIAWATEAVKEAVADGRIPVGLSHYSLISHFGEITSIFTIEKAYINDCLTFRESLMEAGLKYVFTGHMHAMDIASYTNENGKTLYDVETSSLAATPSPIRVVEMFGEEFRLNTIHLDSLKAETLPSYLPEAERQAVLQDYQTYARRGLEKDMMENIIGGGKLSGYVNTLMRLFDIDVTSSGARSLNSDLVALVEGLVYTPLYDEDASEGKTSIESICRSYGVELPEVQAKTAGEYIFNVVAEWFGGDERLELGSADDTVLRYIIYSAVDMVAYFDLFGRLNELNSGVIVVDLKPAMQELFTSQRLDVVKNDLISSLCLSIPAVKDSPIGSMINSGSAAIMKAVSALITHINLYGLDLSGLLEGKEGYIDFDAIFTLAIGTIGEGILNDFSEPDNSCVLSRADNAQ